MGAPMINEDSLKTVAAAISVVGILGSSAAGFSSWAEKRSIKAKHKDAIELADRRITFLTTWFKAQEPICTPQRLEEIKLEVSRELDYIRQSLSQSMIQVDRSTFSQQKVIQQTFLLFLPRNPGGWMCHALFYILLFIAIAGVLSIPQNLNDIKYISDTVMGFIVFLVPMSILQRLALRFNRRT
jgi:hypothetical protein